MVYRPSFEEVNSIAQNILGRVKHRPKIGIVCGSGLGGLADDVQDAEILPYSEIPTFPVSTGRSRLNTDYSSLSDYMYQYMAKVVHSSGLFVFRVLLLFFFE